MPSVLENPGTISIPESNKPKRKEKEHFTRRFNAFSQEAQSWMPAWRELSQHINPTRGFFDGTQPGQGKKIDHRTVIDGHARRAVRTLASGMTSGLTSPSRPWFRLSVADHRLGLIPEVKLWCDAVQTILLDICARSNIYGIFHSIYEEIATFGTAAAFIGYDFSEVIRGRGFTIGEYYLACGPDGRVNAFARPFSMTAIQMVQEFGIDRVSNQVKRAYKDKQTEQWFRLRWLVEENDDRVPGFSDFKNMVYRSVYWEESSEPHEYLRIGGFEEFPILAPRWDTTTTADPYGRGPGWDALGDVKMLQKEQIQKLTAMDKVIDPPVQHDSSIENPNLFPGGVSKYSALSQNAGVRPTYQINPDFNALHEAIIDTRTAISESFYSNLFLMLIDDNKQMTAAEVAARQSEKLQILGPVLERLENEQLSPFITREFNIALRAGLLPPPPKQIRGRDLKIQYISILAQAQKMVGVTAIDQWVAGVGATASIKPEAADIVDVDELNAEKAEMLGIPAKIVHSPEEMAAIREERADAQMKAQQAQLALAASQAAKNASGATKDLANAPVGQNNAIDAVIGAAGR